MNEKIEYQNLGKKINKKSMKSIEEYNKQIKEWNVKMHKICISVLIIINISLICFLFLFNYQINIITFNNISQTKEIIKEEKIKKDYDNQINYMLVNLYTNVGFDNLLYSYFLQSMEEMNRIKDLLISTRGLDVHNRSSIHPVMIFSIYNLPFKKENLREILLYIPNIMILIETFEKKRFGFFWSVAISRHLTTIKDNNAFIFEVDNGKKYMVKDFAEYAIFFPDDPNSDILFKIGDGDFVITKSCFEKSEKCKSNFPESYERNGAINNPFTSNGEFNILDFEVFAFLFF
jgi:hypothetical protein